MCTHTDVSTDNQWWKLTFSTVVQVNWLKIWNRIEWGLDWRLNGAKVCFFTYRITDLAELHDCRNQNLLTVKPENLFTPKK